MRDFSKVSPSLWQSRRFTGLSSDDARYAYLYLLTCEHQTSAGCCRLPDAYAAADLRWPVERYRKARLELIDAELIKWDDDTSVVMITRWFKFSPPMNEKHLQGIRHILERLPSQDIWEEATAELEAIVAAMPRARAGQALNPEESGKGAGKSWTGWKPRAVGG